MPRAKFIGTEKPAATVFSGKVRFFSDLSEATHPSTWMSGKSKKVEVIGRAFFLFPGVFSWGECKVALQAG